MFRLLATATLVLVLCPFALAQDRPALTPDSSVDQILDALDAVGKNLDTFVADVSLAEMDALSGDTTTLVGKIWYQKLAAGNPRIRVDFDKKLIGDRQEQGFRQEYKLENGQLIDRNYKQKLEVIRQVIKPGQKMDPLKLGEGPFPLPIGQRRFEVLRRFDVQKMPPKRDDPANTVHIQLAPKQNNPLARKFKLIDVWVDLKTDFPTRIQTTSLTEATIRTTDLGQYKVNPPLSDKDFALEKVQGWKQQVEQFQE